MPTRGAQVVILSAEQRETLRIKREDLQVWTVHGGRIAAGETAEQAAVREAHEETGFNMRLTTILVSTGVPNYRKGDRVSKPILAMW
jgi:ADP-ribose pyrophosphatase YjhB (NUDIX family)